MFEVQQHQSRVIQSQPNQFTLISCNICSKNLEPKQFEELWQCHHQSCINCVKYYVLHKFKSGQTSIKCPYQSCNQSIFLYSQKRCLQLLLKYANTNFKECTICSEKINPEKFQNLSQCNHQYCKDCLYQYLYFKIKNEFSQIKCPNEACSLLLNKQCQVYKSVPQYLKIRYEKILQNINFISKKSYRLCPNCEKTQLNELKGEQNLFCVNCVKKYCKICLNPAHKKYARCDNAVVSILKYQLQFMKCKNCAFFVQKNQGCNHITCKCGHQFCYLCGQQWNNGGHICPPRRKQIFIRPRTVQRKMIPQRQLINIAKKNIQFNFDKLPPIYTRNHKVRPEIVLNHKLRRSSVSTTQNSSAVLNLVLSPARF